MATEINDIVQQKEAALARSQEKIDIAQEAINNKQKAVDRLKAEQARKEADLDRMRKIAEDHEELQQTYDASMEKRRAIAEGHIWDPNDPASIKLADNEEYRRLKADTEALEPKLKETLPLLKKIYYGKG